MKLLLFDENISPRLANMLTDIYPGSVHVSAIGFEKAFDKEIWEYARQNDYIIVTKDADFSELSLLLNFPPKIIWIRRGNCSTTEIEKILRESYVSIVTLSDDSDQGILTLF